ncbi:MAG: cation:proton antiporter [bacterium]|nr:cation:proton antiporter [bacterium]
MDNIFFQISILLAMTVAIAFVIRLMRQPLIIAYIVAGIIAGPMFFNLLHGDKDMYEAFAQFGVVLLLFIIGLNLNFKHLKSIGRASFITGIGQVLFTSIVGVLLLLALDFSLLSAIYLAVAITFSSTIIIMKLLSDKKETETVYGRHTIGLMLVQDVIAVLIMIFIGIMKDGNGLTSSFLALALKGVVVLAIIILVSRYLLPKLLNRISNSSELLFIFTVTWCFGLASVLYFLGFSIEIGAIIAGISLSSSPYQLEIASRIKPLRDFFLILFFIVLGSQMAIGSMNSIWIPGIALSLFILIGNPLILYLIFRMLKFTRRNSFLAGLTAAQVSEFGFVVLFTGGQVVHLDENLVSIFTLVAITTIFISSYMIIYSNKIYKILLPFFNLFGPDKHRQRERVPAMYDTWVVGYHRIGMRVCYALKKTKTKFSVIDYDPSAIHELNKRNIPAIFGDIADAEFLGSLPIAGARMIIMTIPSLDDQINLIRQVRRLNSKIIILASAYHYEHSKILYAVGADYVMMPHLLGANWISGVLMNKRLTKKYFTTLKDEQVGGIENMLPV